MDDFSGMLPVESRQLKSDAGKRIRKRNKNCVKTDFEKVTEGL